MNLFFQFSSIFLSSLLVVNPLYAQSSAPGTAPEIQLRVVESNGISVQAGSQSAKAFTVQVADAAGTAIADAAVVVRLPDDGPTGTFGDGTHAAIGYTDPAGTAHFGNISWSSATGGMAIRITATKGDSHAGMLLDGTVTSGPPTNPPAIPPAAPLSTPESVTADKPAVQEPVVSSKAAVLVAPPVPVQQPGAVQNPARAIAPPPAIAPTEPTVSVIHRGGHEKGGERIDTGSHKKWIILAVVIAAGAGAGIAMAGHGKSGSSSSSSASTGVSIGSPTVSVGAP